MPEGKLRASLTTACPMACTTKTMGKKNQGNANLSSKLDNLNQELNYSLKITNKEVSIIKKKDWQLELKTNNLNVRV